MENVVKEYLKLGKQVNALLNVQEELRLKMLTDKTPEARNDYEKAFNVYMDMISKLVNIENKYSDNEEFQRLLRQYD